jgi:CubicO group peptidase (beta-lactamase class C family)
VYAATLGSVDGVRLFGDATRELATTAVTTGGDRCLYMETKFGMGFMCADGILPLAGPRSFGHAGAGGSIGYADPDLGIGYGYVMNHMTSSLLGDPRTSGLTDAVKRSLS